MGNRWIYAFGVMLFVSQGATRLAAQSNYEPYQFLTLAGTGSVGSSDGAGNVAQFSAPAGVALDSQGNIYVADSTNYTIRKVAPNGQVSTYAGMPGVPGSNNGSATVARFRRPLGVAVDGADNVYVADTDDSTIRKISPTGNVTTFAGMSSMPGAVDGPAATARFAYPTGVAVDDAQNLYVADFSNDTIRVITPGGIVSTLAGLAGVSGSTDGPGGVARFNNPWGVAVTHGINPDIYVADYANSMIRKITSFGVVTTIAGAAGVPGSADGPSNGARFDYPSGLVLNGAGAVFVSDTLNHLIRKISSSGIVTTLAGSAGIAGASDGAGSAALFDYPVGIALDGGGNLYVADYGNNKIRRGIAIIPRVTSIVHGSNGTITLTGLAAPNQLVNVEATAILTQGFIYLTTIQANGAGQFQFQEVSSSQRKFYRVYAN